MAPPENVLSVGSLTNPAATQTTPSTYCASLGNPSCEVLNVEPGGMGVGGSSAEGDAIFLIKMCVNGKFSTRVVAYASGTAQVIFNSSGDNKYFYYLQKNGNDASFTSFSRAMSFNYVSPWPFTAAGSTSNAVDLAAGCW